MSIYIDFGNIWEALAAFGTILASVIALCVAYKDNRKRLDSILAWDNTTGFTPLLYVSNECDKLIVLDEISVLYKNKLVKKYCLRDPHQFSEQSAIYPNTVQKFQLQDLENFKTNNIDSKKLNHPYNLEIVLKDNGGKKYCFKQKISDEKIFDLIESQTLLSDD